MKWKMPKTYHDFMDGYKELIVWPTKKEKKEEPKKEIKISSAEE